MAKVAVVGASGFVGRYVLQALLQQGHEVLAVCRRTGGLPAGVEVRAVTEYGDRGALRNALRGARAVVHVAGRAHRPVGTAAQRRACELANAQHPAIAALAAAEVGVARFVFTSSIAVHGARSARALQAQSPLRPVGAYGAAKLRAERALRALHTEHRLELSCVRPPLVYGRGAPGNFARLLQLVARAPALPFGAIDNRRSLLAVENLAALLVRAALVGGPPPLAMVASDAPPLSTRDLTQQLALAMGRRPVLLPIPPQWLRGAAAALGQSAAASKLLDDLVVSATEAEQGVGFQPVVCAAEALASAARSYRRGSPRGAWPKA